MAPAPLLCTCCCFFKSQHGTSAFLVLDSFSRREQQLFHMKKCNAVGVLLLRSFGSGISDGFSPLNKRIFQVRYPWLLDYVVA